jgi:hypothetical protein
MRTYGRALESDSIRGASGSVALNIKQVIEIERLITLKSFISNRNNLILRVTFNT